MDENEGWDKGLGDNMLLAMLRNLLLTHRGITSIWQASTTAFAFNTLPYDSLNTNQCLFGIWTFSTDTPSLYLEIEGVRDAAPTL